ncbi:MAG: VOC family protein [Ignavibacteriaceae bacterium]|jgi:methylmalonyl-CoA/ethylmalonyl-CoA epimerase
MKSKKINYNFFGGDAILDHIGIAVKSIEEIHTDIISIIDEIQKVKVAFINMNGAEIELVEPLSDDSPVSRLLEKGQSFYHLCFRVKNLDEAILTARKNGFHCIAKPVEAAAFNKKRIAWLFSKIFGLFELVES